MHPRPLILGHRSASALAPENTLAAFSRALDDGAEGFEFDVRLSKDGAAVVIHDPTLKRTGLDPRSVSALTAIELQAIDVGTWFDQEAGKHLPLVPSYSGERIPTLREVFEHFGTSCALYVEMKSSPQERQALASEVVRQIHLAGVINQVVVESFDLEAAAEIKRIDSAIRTAALFEPRLRRPISSLSSAKMIETAKGCGADEIAFHHTLASARAIEKAKREKLEVVVWTVDDVKWIERAREDGVKALITNNPKAMV